MRDSTKRRYRRHKSGLRIYGGNLLKTRLGRSTKRPLESNEVIHVVLSAKRFLTPHEKRIEKIIRRSGARFSVKICNLSVRHNHIHISVVIENARGYKSFIRAMTGAIALAVGSPKNRKFWNGRPYTRVTDGPLDAEILDNYIELNKLEAGGLSRKEARKLLLKSKRERWSDN